MCTHCNTDPKYSFLGAVWSEFTLLIGYSNTSYYSSGGQTDFFNL